MRASPNTEWILGFRSVEAALHNPQRRCQALYASPKHTSSPSFQRLLARANVRVQPLPPQPHTIKNLPSQAVEHTVFGLFSTLAEVFLEDILPETDAPSLVVALDQVVDPQNVGAILRTCAVFGAAALVLPHHGSPSLNLTIAKVAAGGYEHVPLVRVTNFSRALAFLKSQGYWCYGLAEGGDQKLSPEAFACTQRICLVLGGEEKGLRPLVRKTCDHILEIVATREFSTLNVSNAAAIGLYTATQALRTSSLRL